MLLWSIFVITTRQTPSSHVIFDLLKGGHAVTGSTGYYTAAGSQLTEESAAVAEMLLACVQYES